MPEQHALVSIVMPTFNRASYISETIQSIQAQTWQNWELIIIDDGSEDITTQIVKGINDARIQFYEEIHIGMDKARNKGMQLSKGEFIALIDSDDLWVPAKIEKQLKALTENADAKFCLTSGYNFREKNIPIDFFYEQKNGIRTGDLFPAFFKSELTTLPSALLFKKECLETTGSIKETPLAHVEFILSLAKNFKGIILYEPLTCRRLHETNYSTINNLKRHKDGIQMLRSFQTEIPKKILIESLFRSHINFGESCLRNSKRSEAFGQFMKAWKYKPLSLLPLRKMVKTALGLREK